MTSIFGYTGKILTVDLSSARMTDMPTANYTDRFIGGAGIAAKIWWDELLPQIKAFDPENRLIFITGPLGGVPRLGGSRWLICGKSPAIQPEHFSFAVLGGSWGAHLKFAGYDGIIIQGKSERPVYLLVQDGVAELRDASALWGKTTVEVRNILKDELGSSTRIVATGPAGENLVSMASVLADDDASGSGGFGAVMGSKKLKAIAVRGSGKIMVANPERLQDMIKYIRELIRDRPKNVDYTGFPASAKKMKPAVCFGCLREFDCMRATYEAADGEKGKWTCHSGGFYIQRATNYYGEFNDVPFKATKLCDKYGIDIGTVHVIIAWLSKCYDAGILTDENTGIPISKIGSLEFMETLVKKISLREGFGDILAEGIYRAAESVGSEAKEMLTDYCLKGQNTAYHPRIYIATGLFWAAEPRRRIAQYHEIAHLVTFFWNRWVDRVEGMYMSSKVARAIAKKFWGGELAQDFSTHEGMALAAKIIQDRGYANESLILCGWAWPILEVKHSEDHVGDPTIESKLYSAVTGNEVDEGGLYRIGERAFNLQRAIYAREGRIGRKDDQLDEFNYTVPIKAGLEVLNPRARVPGKDGEPLIKVGYVVDKEKFEKMLDEYYELRGWDVNTGLQTKSKLVALDLDDVAKYLEPKGLIV